MGKSVLMLDGVYIAGDDGSTFVPAPRLTDDDVQQIVETTVCPDCGGQMKIVAALTDPQSIRAYLEGVGLPSRAPPIAPARPHPQRQLAYAS